MSGEPLVSVIVPFYNVPFRFFEEAIESVLGQTHGNVEIVLVDDGSTDQSGDVARSYANQFPGKICCLEHPGHQNHGTRASRELGIRHAKGEYVAFLDADDLWFPHKLEQQVAILDAHPQAAMVYGKALYWFSWDDAHTDASRDFVQDHDVYGDDHLDGIRFDDIIHPPALLKLFLQGKAAVPPPSSILVRRRVIDRLGGLSEPFESELLGHAKTKSEEERIEQVLSNLYEDQVFYAKVCLESPVFVSNRCWERYRQHPDSLCAIATNAGEDRFARLIYLEWVAKYLISKQKDGTDVWQSLRKAQWQARHPTLARLLRKGRRLAGLWI